MEIPRQYGFKKIRCGLSPVYRFPISEQSSNVHFLCRGFICVNEPVTLLCNIKVIGCSHYM